MPTSYTLGISAERKFPPSIQLQETKDPIDMKKNCIAAEARGCTRLVHMPPPLKTRKNENRGVRMTATKIKEHASRVMKELGKGHSERVYHRAMITSLNRSKIAHRSEVLSPIFFMGEVVGMGRCDLVIGDIVVEIKANSMQAKAALPQIKKYIANLSKAEKTKFSGMVLNFNQTTGRAEIWLTR